MHCSLGDSFSSHLFLGLLCGIRGEEDSRYLIIFTQKLFDLSNFSSNSKCVLVHTMIYILIDETVYGGQIQSLKIIVHGIIMSMLV